jgi:hypothetical protein
MQGMNRFVALLKDAGLSEAKALQLARAVDRCGDRPGTADALATLLFNWRRRFGNKRLAEARDKARSILREFPLEREQIISTFVAVEVAEDPEQLTLEDLMREMYGPNWASE